MNNKEICVGGLRSLRRCVTFLPRRKQVWAGPRNWGGGAGAVAFWASCNSLVGMKEPPRKQLILGGKGVGENQADYEMAGRRGCRNAEPRSVCPGICPVTVSAGLELVRGTEDFMGRWEELLHWKPCQTQEHQPVSGRTGQDGSQDGNGGFLCCFSVLLPLLWISEASRVLGGFSIGKKHRPRRNSTGGWDLPREIRHLGMGMTPSGDHTNPPGAGPDFPGGRAPVLSQGSRPEVTWLRRSCISGHTGLAWGIIRKRKNDPPD